MFADPGRSAGKGRLGRVERVVTEHDTDVLEWHAASVERSREGAAQVMRPQVRDTDLVAAAVDHLTDAFDAQRTHRCADLEGFTVAVRCGENGKHRPRRLESIDACEHRVPDAELRVELRRQDDG